MVLSNHPYLGVTLGLMTLTPDCVCRCFITCVDTTYAFVEFPGRNIHCSHDTEHFGDEIIIQPSFVLVIRKGNIVCPPDALPIFIWCAKKEWMMEMALQYGGLPIQVLNCVPDQLVAADNSRIAQRLQKK